MRVVAQDEEKKQIQQAIGMIAATGGASDSEHIKKIADLLQKQVSQVDQEAEHNKKMDEDIRAKDI